MLQVTLPDGRIKKFAKGTTLAEIGKDFEDRYDSPIATGIFNGQAYSLHYAITEEGEVDFIPLNSVEGMRAFVRSITFVCDVAMKKLFPGAELEVCNTLGSALYCIVPKLRLTPDQLMKLEAEMRRIVEEKHPIEMFPVSRQEAIERARQDPYLGGDVMAMIEMAPESETLFAYELCGIREPFFEALLSSTEHLFAFELIPFDKGFVINYPEMNDYTVLPPWDTARRINHAYREAEEWSAMIGCNTIAKLNRFIREGRADKIIRVAEGLQEKKFISIADHIAAHRDKLKFILIAGPSSSGKTSSNYRLCVQMEVNGLHPIPISMDNYYVNREDTPLDENGERDYECLEALDIELFNHDMSELLKEKRVEMPTFNFLTGLREYKGDSIQLSPQDILLIEGIHGLNDRMTYALPEESRFRIYISALTSINIDEHNRIPTTDGRLIRRIVRDQRTRGTSAQETIARWPSVRRGEDRYIFKNQEKADVMFNSALAYELACLKVYAEPLLFSIHPDAAEYQEAKRLLKFLDYFLPVPGDEVPNNSLLREFIGGSIFRV